MKIVLISTWPPRWCGIASYSEELVSALRREGVGVEIVCHTDGGRTGEKQVHPVLDQRKYDWYRAVWKEVEKINPELVHIQHEFGIYSVLPKSGEYDFSPENSFGIVNPLFRWKVGKRPVVMTYHSVFSKMTYGEAMYYRHTFDLAAANIVHEPLQKKCLPRNLGLRFNNVFVCPHGAEFHDIKLQDKTRAKKKLGLDKKIVCGMIGWWEPNKGFERVVKIWPKISKRFPEARLILAGDARKGSVKGPAYKRYLLGLIEKSKAKDSIRVVMGAFAPLALREILSSFDFAVLPYLMASQSGNLADGYGVGIPAVVSDMEGLGSSIRESKGGIPVKNNEGLERAIEKLLGSKYLREKFSKNIKRYVQREVSWPKIAQRHIKIYKWAKKKIKDKSQYSKYLNKRLHV